MNVAQFSFEYPPSTTGGLGIYLQGLVEYQRGMGDRVDVFFLGSGQPPNGTISLPFYKSGELISYKLDQISKLNKQVPYDLIVCQDWAGIFASKPLWNQSIPLITTCHLPLAWDIGYYDDLPCEFADKLEFFAMVQSDLIIAVSNSVKHQLEETFSFTKGKIGVIYNGTDTTFFLPGLKSAHSVILYVGRFFEQKGFDLLPEIFFLLKKNHPDLFLKIIGTGPLKSEILRKFEDLNLIGSIKFYDFSPQEKVLELYREAAVVVLPSRHEPFGLVAIESMATATPVVASSVGGLKEIISHSEDGFLVTPSDVKGFADTISHLLNDKQHAEVIGRKARNKIIENFDQKICFKKTRSSYIDLIMDFRNVVS